MNKKRLYKQDGRLHERGKRVSRDIGPIIHKIFQDHSATSPRDLEMLICHLAGIYANVAVYRSP
jgi:hypothetical protein